MHATSGLALTLALELFAVGCGTTSGATKPDSAAATTKAASTTTFVSSWKSPTAQPLQIKGAKVAAIVIMSDLAARRSAEDRLASELSARGAVGVPMYSIVDQANVEGEPIARGALEQAQVQGVVVLHPGDMEQQQKPASDYTKAPYAAYWDGYYSYGWASPWTGATGATGATSSATEPVVSVETLIYSLRQNQLVWAGKSRTTNPASLADLVSELAGATANELSQLALLQQ